MSNCRGVCVFSYICFFVAFAGVKEHLKGHRRRHWSVLRACHRTAATPTGHQTHTRNHTDSHADNQVAKTKHTQRYREVPTAKSKHLSQAGHSLRQANASRYSFTLASFTLATTSHLCTPAHA